MNFEETTGQKDIARTFQEVAMRHASTAPNDCFHWDAWHALSDAGLWRLAVPREHGGNGNGWGEFTAAFESIVATLRSIGFAMALANQATLIRALLKHANPAQRNLFLPRLLAGEPAAMAISERGTGTEIRALETTLMPVADGYRLDGQKYNISHAPDAALILVVARVASDARPATALVIVDPSRPGVTRTPPQATMGVRDLPIGDLAFNGVRVDAHEVLGSPADGLHRLMDIASMNRALFGLLCANVTLPFLSDAMTHLHSRKALDVALDTHQHVQRRLVDIRIGIARAGPRWLHSTSCWAVMSTHSPTVRLPS